MTEEIKNISKLEKKSKDCFDRISKKYAKSSWVDFSGHGSQGQSNLEQAKKYYDKIEINPKDFNLEEIDFLINSAESLTNESKELFNDIIELEKNILSCKERAEEEIDLAAKDIKKAEDYISSYGGSIDSSFEGDLRVSNNDLSYAVRELSKDKPDFILLVEKALSANHAADDILDKAMSEKQSTDRKKRLLQSEITLAQDSINRAKRYHRSHYSDLSSSCRSSLSSAEEELERALGDIGLSAAINLAESAKRKAKSSLSAARRDVDSAENSRRMARQRSSSTYSPSSFVSSSSSSFGGGGSSSFGGGFGGSSFGGGGSSGW